MYRYNSEYCLMVTTLKITWVKKMKIAYVKVILGFSRGRNTITPETKEADNGEKKNCMFTQKAMNVVNVP